ncbi:MAG: hypothetical protein ACLQPH_04020 [Acidimicrobiales bacterium]
MNEIRVAILVGDQVIATSDNPADVRLAAGMMSRCNTERSPVLWPIAEGRREACRRIAMAEV